MGICLVYFTCFIYFMHIIKAKKVHRLEDYISPADLTSFSNWDLEWEKMKSDLHDWENEHIKETPKPKPKLRSTEINCFGASLLSKILPSIFSTNTATESSFTFCSRKKCATSQHLLKNLTVGSDEFSPDRSTVILVHGFMSHGDALWIQEMKKAFLAWANVNIIVVNWNNEGSSWMYWKAVENTRQIGSHIATLVKHLKNTTHVKITRFHCVGHSLGAHVCAHASTEAGLFGRITGLDPAQPCFDTNDPSKRLDPSDACYVDVIHTNGGLYRKLDLGFADPLGTADFYPNGGHIQPGCVGKEQGSSWVTEMVTAVHGALREAVCSHGRAYEYFTNSLVYANESSACSFRAFPWKLGEHEPRRNNCSAQVCPEMGINAIGSPEHVRAKGSYFVATKDEEPYCIPVSSNKHKDKDTLAGGAFPVQGSLTLLFVLVVNRVGVWLI